jgi:hypothetical protein
MTHPFYIYFEKHSRGGPVSNGHFLDTQQPLEH